MDRMSAEDFPMLFVRYINMSNDVRNTQNAHIAQKLSYAVAECHRTYFESFEITLIAYLDC